MPIFDGAKKEEETTMKLVAIQLPEDVVSALKEEAHVRFISMSDVVRECIFDSLRTKGKMPERR